MDDQLSRRRWWIGASMACGILMTSPAQGALTVYREDDQRAWEQDVESWGTMDFTGFQPGTRLTDQYRESLGVTFIDSNHFVDFGRNLFPRDSWGIQTGTFTEFAEFTLDTPHLAISLFHPGRITVELYLGDELVGEEDNFEPGFGHFFGLVSDVPFDRVRVGDIAGIGFADDIRLAMQVPGPGAAGVLAVAIAGAGRRRRGG